MSLHFSIFEDDGTFGGAKRVVVLQGTTTVSQWISPNVFDVRGDIVRWLQSDGFDVVNVRISGNSWIGYGLDLEIEVNAYLEYSAEQIRQRAIQVIESITRSLGTTIKVFHNTQLRVIADNLPQQQQQSGNTQQLPSNQNYPTNYPATTGGGNNDDDKGDFWGNLGFGAGLSTPVVAVSAVILAIMILRK